MTPALHALSYWRASQALRAAPSDEIRNNARDLLRAFAAGHGWPRLRGPAARRLCDTTRARLHAPVARYSTRRRRPFVSPQGAGLVAGSFVSGRMPMLTLTACWNAILRPLRRRRAKARRWV